MTLEIATLIISMIEQVLPLFNTGAATTALIENIITLLQKILPLIVDFVPTVYTSIKNIIAVLKADPTTVQAQWDALDALDTQVDAAFDAAAAAVDPDVPAATPPATPST